MVYDGHCKSGTSKKDSCNYVFELIKSDELPDNYKKSTVRPRKYTAEEKWQKQLQMHKNWCKQKCTCLKCDILIKNGSKYIHNKLYCPKIKYNT